MPTNDLIQYIIVRKDLISTLKWPIGAVMTQACHAVAATLKLFNEDEHTINYLEDLDNMRKCMLQVLL